MAKHKYVLLGPEIGAANVPVIKELVIYGETPSKSKTVRDNEAQNFISAVIRLAEVQSVKRTE